LLKGGAGDAEMVASER